MGKSVFRIKHASGAGFRIGIAKQVFSGEKLK